MKVFFGFVVLNKSNATEEKNKQHKEISQVNNNNEQQQLITSRRAIVYLIY